MQKPSLTQSLLDSVVQCLTRDSAQRLVDLRADDEMQVRIDLLAGKCNNGELSDDEQSEYEQVVRVSQFVALLQSKARQRLRDEPASFS